MLINRRFEYNYMDFKIIIEGYMLDLFMCFKIIIKEYCLMKKYLYFVY